MTTNYSVDVFLRTLDERFDVFKRNLEALLQALAGNKPDQKLAAATQALTAADDLERSLSSHDQPPWLGPILVSLKSNVKRVNDETRSYQLARALALEYARIQDHKWSFAEEEDTGFDFDGLYESFREQSRVPELFDILIGALEKIAANQDIDSRRVVQALEKLIQSLKRNRRGSYFAT
ncbi:hypothetical protein LCGC14_2495350, partial [marine sediment metagenome]